MIPSKNVSRETKVCLVFYLISFNHPTKWGVGGSSKWHDCPQLHSM
jgi:hypothetical protein